MFQKQLDTAVAVWNGADPAMLDAVFAPDFVRHTVLVGKPASSLAGLKQVIREFRTAFPDMMLTVNDVAFMADRAFLHWTVTGTNTGPGDMPPTGKRMRLSGMSLLRFVGGKAVEEFGYFDSLDFLVQLGLAEAPKLP